GFNRQFISSFQTFGSTLVQFQRTGGDFGGPPSEDERLRRVLTLEDARAIARRAWAIEQVSPERWRLGGPDVRGPRERMTDADVGGVTHTYPLANAHFTERGRFFTEGEERHDTPVAIIGPSLAETLFPNLDPLGRTIHVEGRPFTVIGVFEEKGSFLGGSADDQVVIPIGVFDRIWPDLMRTHGCVIATVPRRPEWLNLAVEQGTQILRERRGIRFGEPNDFEILTPERLIRIFRQVTGGVSAAMLAIAGISLVIGGVGVMNIMLMNVTQRTREIGIRKALGARRRDILQQFLTEAVTLALAGGVAGVAAGLGIAYLLGALSPFPANPSVGAVVSGLGVAMLVGLFFGTY
ncbi:MAG: ABC transporter permease, partial [Candidatus Rokuibacteriota bacterium]